MPLDLFSERAEDRQPKGTSIPRGRLGRGGKSVDSFEQASVESRSLNDMGLSRRELVATSFAAAAGFGSDAMTLSSPENGVPLAEVVIDAAIHRLGGADGGIGAPPVAGL